MISQADSSNTVEFKILCNFANSKYNKVNTKYYLKNLKIQKSKRKLCL